MPNYFEPHEVKTLLAYAPHDRARMLLMLQWRAGLRISEILSLKVGDIQLRSARPTLAITRPLPVNDRRYSSIHPAIIEARLYGETTYARVVPVHPELAEALRSWEGDGDGHVLKTPRSTANRWMRSAVATARRRRRLAKYARPLSSRTLRNGYIVHMLVHGIPVDTLRQWLGLGPFHRMSRYIELLPDPEAIPDKTGLAPEVILATIP
ncbi:MAG: phage integrase family protein [Dehalococcoidia bacterium]|nr:phage integrase family protein [Dehalococcoidia bacterium]